MSSESLFTKDNLNSYLTELGKEFRKLNGTKMPAEIILIGGASILANYGFRESTYDIDAVILASSAMKEAINIVGDRLGLPSGWLNMDFQNTKSYSRKLPEISVYYKTFFNILNVRTVAAEYLVAMKLMSGRQYKNDFSDIVGILWEHQKDNRRIERETVERALETLYGKNAMIPAVSRKFIGDIFDSGEYEEVLFSIRDSERLAKETLLAFDKDYPGEANEDNIEAILEQARRKHK